MKIKRKIIQIKLNFMIKNNIQIFQKNEEAL